PRHVALSHRYGKAVRPSFTAGKVRPPPAFSNTGCPPAFEVYLRDQSVQFYPVACISTVSIQGAVRPTLSSPPDQSVQFKRGPSRWKALINRWRSDPCSLGPESTASATVRARYGTNFPLFIREITYFLSVVKRQLLSSFLRDDPSFPSTSSSSAGITIVGFYLRRFNRWLCHSSALPPLSFPLLPCSSNASRPPFFGNLHLAAIDRTYCPEQLRFLKE
ncbi:hypothetical protein B296_00009573, partial [Ensete ventricosum]